MPLPNNDERVQAKLTDITSGLIVMIEKMAEATSGRIEQVVRDGTRKRASQFEKVQIRLVDLECRIDAMLELSGNGTKDREKETEE